MHRVNFNTSSNAVKVYNVKLALSKFSGKNKVRPSNILSHKFPLSQNSALLEDKPIHHQDIVDGHGEITVGYLWNIALMFQVQ